jgi:membrane-associated phospholipid phosphatase
MATIKADQPIRRIRAAAEQAARSETVPPEIRNARTVVVQVSLVVLAVAFGLLTILVKLTSSFPMDLQVARFLQTSNHPWLRASMIAVSWVGDFPRALLPIGLITLFLYGSGVRWEAVMSVVSAAVVETVNLVMKTFVHRLRPAADLVNVLSGQGGYSFPSGHVMFFVGYLGFLWFLAFSLLQRSWRRTLLLVILGLMLVLVGPSRVYLGAHWPSDVLGAYLLGILVLAGMVYVYRWGKPRFFVRPPVSLAPAKAGGSE